MASYYELLQVPVDASDEAIKRSARWARKAVTHDPDRERRLAAIDEAYATLSYPSLRRTYDGRLAAGTAPDEARNGVPLIAADQPLPLKRRGCAACGAIPARNFPPVRITGLVVWLTLQIDRRGTVRHCRDHGRRRTLAAMRHNLVFGWWGILALPANIMAIAYDLIVLLRYSQLGEPTLPEAVDVATVAAPEPPKRGRFLYR